jgi:ATP sulfurylase
VACEKFRQAVLAAHLLQGQDLAVMTVSSKWAPNKPKEAKHCYGTTSIEHPGVSMISMERGKYYLGEDCIQISSISKDYTIAAHAAVGPWHDRLHGCHHTTYPPPQTLGTTI